MAESAALEYRHVPVNVESKSTILTKLPILDQGDHMILHLNNQTTKFLNKS